MSTHCRRITSAWILIILASACSDTNGPGPSPPRVGQVFPELILTAFDNQKSSLYRYRGKVVILNIWAAWCGPCLAEMPSLQRLHEKLDSERFSVLGLTVDDDRFLAEEFLSKHAIEFPNYIDENRHNVENTLGVKYFPQTFVIGRKGILLMHDTGYRIWDTPEMERLLEQYFSSSSD